MRYDEKEPTRQCPYCGETCYADWVDIGVGYQQCGPFYCANCGASQIGPCDVERALTPEEKSLEWYKPASPPGSSVNAVRGVPVDHRTAKELYTFEAELGIKILDPIETRKEEETDDDDF